MFFVEGYKIFDLHNIDDYLIYAKGKRKAYIANLMVKYDEQKSEAEVSFTFPYFEEKYYIKDIIFDYFCPFDKIQIYNATQNRKIFTNSQIVGAYFGKFLHIPLYTLYSKSLQFKAGETMKIIINFVVETNVNTKKYLPNFYDLRAKNKKNYNIVLIYDKV